MSLIYQEETRASQIVRLYAFLGRYAHQDVRSMREMPLSELVSLAKATGQLLEEETAANSVNTD